MIYLEKFTLPSQEQENDFFWHLYRNEFHMLPPLQRKNYPELCKACHNTVYPFSVFTDMYFDSIEFEPITILYGGNGTGKTTILNIIAEQLKVKRSTMYNRSDFFESYLQYCKAYTEYDIPDKSCIITSDDVFNYIMDIRALNEGIDNKRKELFQEYRRYKKKSMGYRLKSLKDYEEFSKVQTARNNSPSKYIMKELGFNAREHSNGENALTYFTEKIKENALYLLDEPENSLSPKRQLELVKFIEDSARFYNCQFIISTHSPFLLALPHAVIYIILIRFLSQLQSGRNSKTSEHILIFLKNTEKNYKYINNISDLFSIVNRQKNKRKPQPPLVKVV